MSRLESRDPGTATSVGRALRTGLRLRIVDHRRPVSRMTESDRHVAAARSGFLLCGLALCVLSVVGCSGGSVPTSPVSGTVTLTDGAPVQTGTVEFSSVDGDWIARGTIQNDGSFRLTTFTDGDGAVPGDHDAVVVQLVSTEDLALSDHDHGPTIDPRYAHYDRSGLRFTVKPDDENVIAIRLEPVTADRTEAR